MIITKAFLDELVDVEIMIEQFKLFISKSKFEKHKKFKLNRVIKMLKNMDWIDVKKWSKEEE